MLIIVGIVKQVVDTIRSIVAYSHLFIKIYPRNTFKNIP